MRFSHASRHLVALGAFLALAANMAQGATLARLPDDAARSARRDAEQFVRQALEAEAGGDAQSRDAYLRDAVTADPSFAPAQWQSGNVRIGTDWLSPEAVADRVNRDGKVDEYRTRRAVMEDTAADHLKMADWCVAAKLKEQERRHLFAALDLQPTKSQSANIQRRLGLRRYQNSTVTAQQASVLDKQAKAKQRSLAIWRSRIEGMRRQLEGSDQKRREQGIAQLEALTDPAVAPALEVVFCSAKYESGKCAVAALSKFPQQGATDALVTFAVFAEDESLRQEAADALRSRTLYSYVPTMLNALQSPVEISVNQTDGSEQGGHRVTMFQEGQYASRSIVLDGAPQFVGTVTFHPKSGAPPSFSRAGQGFDATAADDIMLAGTEAQNNALREALNERVAVALRTATGNQLGSKPAQWWSWWADYNEMYQPYKPVAQTYVTTQRAPPVYRVSYSSCFVAGTPVWTSTGPQPIEQIKAGDCVLSQDPDTGELAYKAVALTTVRPPSPLVEINVGGETIRATRGHPFWVDGTGWQMAKQLQAGQSLHTTSGPRVIDSISQNGEAECFNMVVADFNTYFIGNTKILVHDNNLRQVTTATVPGLIEP